MGPKIMDDQVKDILDRWLLAETRHRLADASLEDNPPNHLCISVIPVVHTYTMAVLRGIHPDETVLGDTLKEEG
jgi:hypothetical protein